MSRCKLAKSYSMTKLSKLLEDSLILDTCWSDAWNLHRPTRIDIMNLNIFSSNKSSTSQEGLEAASCYFCWTVHLDWRDLDRLYLKNAVRWYQFRRRFGLYNLAASGRQGSRARTLGGCEFVIWRPLSALFAWVETHMFGTQKGWSYEPYKLP